MTAQAPADGLIAGKYRLVRLLGRGGMGSVWEARHETLGSRAAIKFIEGDLLDSPEARGRFETEARAAAQIDSKHAIRVDDYGVTDDGKPFIIMEVLEGEGLEKRIHRLGRLTMQDTARIVEQVCRALEKAHSLGIVHRDLKPENIYLAKKHDDHEEVAKVLDFGIAKIASGGHPSAKTRTGVMMGTPEFMSPEQVQGVDVDYRTDLWAMGVIAFRCITGALPFSGVGPMDIGMKIINGAIPVPSQIAPDSPPAFDTWFARAVARDPTRRFGSARDLAASLLMLAGNSAGNRVSVPSSGELRTHIVDAHGPTIATPGVAHTGPGLAAPPRSTQRSSGALFGGLAGVVVLIALAAAFAAYSRFSGDRSEPATVATSRPAKAAPASASTPPQAPSTPQAPSATVAPVAMAAIPAGTFSMGSEDGEPDERPVHQVSVDAFQMDRTEVTVAAYDACVRAGTCSAGDTTEYCNAGKSDRASHPINCVDWTQASTYCGWVGKRLPTEEEWEYAARGTDGRTFPWGSAQPTDQLCWNRWASKSGTCGAGTFASGNSPFGVADMAGNVWEWTSSGYGDDYDKTRVDAARVVRGGGWGLDNASDMRSSNRYSYAPSHRLVNLGFRCVSRPTAGLTVVELAPDDRGFVDTTGGAGWGNRCWVHIQSGQLGWAKAECDQAMGMALAAPQPRASVLFNLGLIEQRTGHAEAARGYYQQSLALRENSDVQAALRSLEK